MNRHALRLVVTAGLASLGLAATFGAAGALPARADDAPAPRPAPAADAPAADTDGMPPEFVLATADDDLEAARRRWEQLTPEQRERLRRAFEKFRDLPPEKQAAFRERLARLGGPEAVKAIRRGLEKSPENVRVHMRRMGVMLERVERHVVERILDDAGRAAWQGLDGRDRDRARRHLMGAAMEWGRDHVLAKHATEEERTALETARTNADREAHHRVFKAVFERARERLLAPHAAELETLEGDARADREMSIHVEALLRVLDARRDAVRAKVAEVVARAGRDGDRDDHADRTGPRRGDRRWGATRMRDAGEDTKAMLGAVFNALKVMPGRQRDEARRRAFQRIGEIRALPDAERPAALRDLLQELLREDARTPKRGE